MLRCECTAPGTSRHPAARQLGYLQRQNGGLLPVQYCRRWGLSRSQKLRLIQTRNLLHRRRGQKPGLFAAVLRPIALPWYLWESILKFIILSRAIGVNRCAKDWAGQTILYF